MSSATATRTFDLSAASADAVREIRHRLELDPGRVLGSSFDAASGRLAVELRWPDDAEDVERVVRGYLRTHRLIRGDVLASHQASLLVASEIDEQLAASEDVMILGPGLTGLRGRLLGLYRLLEAELRELARRFGAEEHLYPALIPSEILHEVGYLGNFPQHLTLCCRLSDELPVLEAVAAEADALDPAAADGPALEALAGRLDEAAEPPRHALTPGVCLPCYRQFRGALLAPGEVRALTVQNHVYRYEAAGFRPLARAWDFHVRDIVFLGSGSDLERLRLEVMDATMELCRRLDLEARLELAHDPFFLDARRDKVIYQRMGKVKYELLLHLPQRSEPFAASSFNLHRDFYTSIYGTRIRDAETSGAPWGHAESACMGFGLERWLYGFLSQKGLDEARWPDWVRAGIAARSEAQAPRRSRAPR